MEIRNRFQIRDVQLENICWALKSEMESNYPSGRLYMDSLAVSIASRLVSTYSSMAYRPVEQNRGLGGRRLKQTLSYIEIIVSEDLSLSQLDRSAVSVLSLQISSANQLAFHCTNTSFSAGSIVRKICS